MSLHHRWVAGALLIACFAPLTAKAQRNGGDVGDVRLAAYFALGVGGDAEVTTGSSESSASLDPTVGFGARIEVPVHEYVAIGGIFELLTFEADTAFADEREAVLDFDVWVKGRYRFEISEGLAIEPYIGVPFGLALAVLDDPDGDGDEVWPGFNIGVLAGAMLIVDSRFGALLELGWRHHQVFTEVSSFLGDVDVSIETNQFAMHFGGFFAF